MMSVVFGFSASTLSRSSRLQSVSFCCPLCLAVFALSVGCEDRSAPDTATHAHSDNAPSLLDCAKVLGYQVDSSHHCLNHAEPVDDACETRDAQVFTDPREPGCLVHEHGDVFLIRWGLASDLQGEGWTVHGLQRFANAANEFPLGGDTPDACVLAIELADVQAACETWDDHRADCAEDVSPTFSDAIARYIPWCEVVDGTVQDSPAAPCLRETSLGDPICCGRSNELPGTSCIDLTDGGTIYGDHGRCLELGEGFDRRVVGGACCDPLVTIQDTFPSKDGTTAGNLPEGCTIGGLSRAICSACGDGVCDNIENRCNCPDDCQPQTDASGAL